MRKFILFACLAVAAPALAQFTDPQDGALDTSEWMIDRKGFMPVPILITEPAVGYGAGLALMFVRNSMRERVEQGKESGHVTPPDIFGVFFAATENGTRFGGAGGMFSFDNDRWRYRGGVGKVHANLDFYGAGGDLGTGEHSIGFTLDGWASSQQLLLRLGESNSFVAARWIYMDTTVTFDQTRPQPIVSPPSLSSRDSGAGLSFEYDSRDNIITPSRGWIGVLDTLFYAPAIGGDSRFQTYRAHVFAYAPVAQQFVLGTRLDGRAARGDVPFYQLPFIDIRGLPKGRYQDDNVGVAELELRWNATARWALVGFYGAGRAWGVNGKGFGDASTIVAKGAGFRYLIARRLGMYMGADVAWGPEDTAFYLQVGSAWR